MTPPIPLLRVSTFLPFVNFLEELGTPTETLLQQCKLPVFALDDPNTLIPRHQVFAFLEKAAYREGILNLGYLVGEKTPLMTLGAFGRLVCQSITLYDAISTVIHLGRCFNSGEYYWLVEKGEKAYFCQEYVNLGGIEPDFASHFSLMLMVDLVQKVAGKRWYPREIALQTRKIAIFSHHYLSQATINSEMHRTAIAFPRSFLSLPMPSQSNFYQHQKQQDYEILQASAPSLHFSYSLKQAIAPQLREGYPSIQLAAEMAQMSVRTLQRRLSDEGLTYSQLINCIRHEISIYLLQDLSLKIIDIAAELGYEDPAHFTRAFKQWTGIPPRSFREQNR